MTEFDSFGSWHSSKSAYARLKLEGILSDVKWCVYCDVDTLFVDDPLKLLTLFDPTKVIIGHEDKLEADQVHVTWLKSKGMLNGDSYVCSGFMLMNLEEFRKENIGSKCIDFIATNPDVKYPDQDALNMYCRGRVGYTPEGWGIFSWEAFKYGKPSCIHYVADLPWKIMTSQYLDFNDPQWLWFDCAKKLYGWRVRDVAIGYSFWPFIRRLMIGFICRTFARFIWAIGIANPGRITSYLLKHYAPAYVWRELAR